MVNHKGSINFLVFFKRMTEICESIVYYFTMLYMYFFMKIKFYYYN